MLKTGGLFSGSGILELVVHQLFGAVPVWFCEHEPATADSPDPTQAAARLLAHRFPEVPNHGDVTTVDWAMVEPVDILTGGFPCTDLSAAGRRAGLRPGTRSGLWSHMAYAIGQLQPKLVVIENVRGLLSTDAHCDLEPCPWCVGDGSGRPLRALGAVLGDLVTLGYDAQWVGLPASAVGAPHGRYRVFVLAWPATDPEGVGSEGAGGAWDGWAGFADSGVAATDPPSQGRRRDLPERVSGHGAASVRSGQTEPGRRDRPATHPVGEGWGPGSGVGGSGGQAVVGDGAPAVADPDGQFVWQQSEPVSGGVGAPVAGGTGAPATDPESLRRGEGRAEHAGIGRGSFVAQRGDDAADWGIYGTAIRRWELILGRPAPAPTITGRRGGQQLSPLFVEWMMGWPDGWGTGVAGLTRNELIRIMGNGVVPQQVAAALAYLQRWLPPGLIDAA